MGVLTPLAIKIGAIPWMPRLLPQIVWIDKVLHRVTGARLSVLDIAGLPNLMMTVVGRKSGLPRKSPLLCVPYGGRFLIAGSYFGGPKTPLWVANLEAAEACTIVFKGTTSRASARLLEGAEREQAWKQMVKVWPNFARYEARTHRQIKVFLLTPHPAAEG